MWWLILVIPLALIVLLLFLKVRLCIVYEEELSVKVKVLFFNYPLFPAKKKKIKEKDYTIKALRKKQKKLEKKSKKKQEKTENTIETKQEQPKDRATKLKEVIELIKIILENVLSSFGRYLKIEIIKMHVKVGTDDPAKTALLYGGVSQGVSYIIELLSNFTNVDVKKRNSITVQPDFVEGKTEARINITLGLRVWHGISLAIKFFMGYLKKKNEKEAHETATGSEKK